MLMCCIELLFTVLVTFSLSKIASENSVVFCFFGNENANVCFCRTQNKVRLNHRNVKHKFQFCISTQYRKFK